MVMFTTPAERGKLIKRSNSPRPKRNQLLMVKFNPVFYMHYITILYPDT